MLPNCERREDGREEEREEGRKEGGREGREGREGERREEKGRALYHTAIDRKAKWEWCF